MTRAYCRYRTGIRRMATTASGSGPRAAIAVLTASAALALLPAQAAADGRVCTRTAVAAVKACRAEVTDDHWTSYGNCINISDGAERQACFEERAEARSAAWELCSEQYQARRDLCGDLGEAPYDPDFDPADFVDPLEIGDGVAPNPYFPLVPGTQLVYEGGDEIITVTVTKKTKLIEGVTCLVVNDLVEEDGQAIEDTDDWYAQDRDGNVWYCGESVQNFEIFEGDDPEKAELVDVEGSWKTGRDHARPGIQMFASPQVGDLYRQEIALGDAEDAAEVIETRGSARVPAASCHKDCVVTREFTPIEPGNEGNKYYAPGIGLILEEQGGARTELVEINMVDVDEDDEHGAD